MGTFLGAAGPLRPVLLSWPWRGCNAPLPGPQMVAQKYLALPCLLLTQLPRGPMLEKPYARHLPPSAP